MNHKLRVKRLQELLGARKLGALLVTHLPDIRYLSGFTGSAGALLVTDSRAVFFTDGRYTEQARAQVQGVRIVISPKPPLTAAAEWCNSNLKSRSSSRRSLGIDADHLTVSQHSRLRQMITSSFRLVQAPALVATMRMMKDAEEIELIRAAVMLGASLFDTALQAIRPGVKETDVAAEMEHAARRAGAEEMSFSTIIASGTRSALPHGRATQARIPPSGFVVCDFGVILAGYCSDMTRTVHVGRPTAEARSIYNAVLEAQDAAVQAVRAGAGVSDVDGSARNLLKSKGLAKYFSHSTGHGVGLEIHEAPRIARGAPDILEPGMVITIEPGIYIAGKCGVRIEDMVVVTERGRDVLTPTTKELIAV